MEDGRQVVREPIVDVAPVVGHPLDVVAEGEEVEEAGQGPDAGQGIGGCHSEQEEVGGTPHGWLAEDLAYDDVCDEGEQDDHGGEISVDGHGVLIGWHKERHIWWGLI